jgi:hypothetical protein
MALATSTDLPRPLPILGGVKTQVAPFIPKIIPVVIANNNPGQFQHSVFWNCLLFTGKL